MSSSLLLSDGDRTLELVSSTLGTGLWLVDFKPPLVAKENTWIDSPDSEGRRRGRSKPTNPEGSGKVGIGHTVSSTFLDWADNFQELVESVHQNRGSIRYTPLTGATAMTFEIESIELTDFPQNLMNLKVCEVEFKFECKPYGKLAEETVWTGRTFNGPIDFEEVTGVQGHVDALAELTLTDASTQSRGHVEVAVQEDFDSAAPEPLLLNLASGLTVSGYAGSSTTRAGSYSTNVARATLTSQPVIVCAGTSQPHKGLWKNRVRVYPSTADMRVRLAWKVGDGPVDRSAPWVNVPSSADWFDLELDTINIGELPTGHSWTPYIEAYATSGTPTVDVDFLGLLPAQRYGRGRSPLVFGTPASFSGRDEFDQTAGALSAKQMPVPSGAAGVWAGAGDTDDFQVDATSHYAYRAINGDSSELNGRYAIAGTTTFTNVLVGVDFSHDIMTLAASQALRQGVFARYVDVNNWLMAFTRILAVGSTSWAYTVNVSKRVSGTETFLKSVTTYIHSPSGPYFTIWLQTDTAGRFFVWLISRGGAIGSPILVGSDTALATGGSLASGKNGFYHARWGTSNVGIGGYDNFVVAVPSTDVAINSGQSARFLHDIALRENAAGTSEGRVPLFDGKHLTLQPATRATRKSRIVVKARRFDVDSGLPDSGTADNLTGDLTCTPRVLLTSD